MEGRLSVYFRYTRKKKEKEKKENVGLDQPTTNRFTTISSLAKGGSGANIILILSHFFLFLILFSFFEGKKFVAKMIEQFDKMYLVHFC